MQVLYHNCLTSYPQVVVIVIPIWILLTVANPACEEVGCGEWKPPLIANPDYKGKWSAPLMDNPMYQGIWKPRRIPNPAFFEDNNPYQSLTPIVKKYLNKTVRINCHSCRQLLLSSCGQCQKMFTLTTLSSLVHKLQHHSWLLIGGCSYNNVLPLYCCSL